MTEDELRGTGRTTNIILATVRKAIDNAGSPVFVKDHHPSLIADYMVLQKVNEILLLLNIDHTVNAGTMSITVSPRKNASPIRTS